MRLARLFYITYVVLFPQVPAFFWQQEQRLNHALLEPTRFTTYVSYSVCFPIRALDHRLSCMLVGTVIAILQYLGHLIGICLV